MQNETAGPFFVETILDRHFATDLYELDLSTHAIRRLTTLGNIVPEFYFDSSGTRLLWTGGGNRPTLIGQFAFVEPPTGVAPAINPVKAWIGAPRSAPVVRPRTVSPSENSSNFNAKSIPPSVVTGFSVLQTQLTELAALVRELPQGPSCCHATG
jgi:hypothetical protein